jgi:hypothetical protein
MLCVLCISCSRKIESKETFVSKKIVEHSLPLPVSWKTDKIVGKIKVKSTIKMKNWKTKRVEKIYYNAKSMFFNNFENISCDPNKLGQLEIRIISADMLRDKRYFHLATPRNFGRYFPSSNTIYIIYDVFNHPEYLAHELAHYFYDECGVKFKNISAEHVRVYKFQDFYKERNRYGR